MPRHDRYDRHDRPLPRAIPRGRRGMSLVELLIVISIIAVVAGAAITTWEPQLHDQLMGVGQVIVADAAYARDLAVTNNSTYRLTFDGVEDEYVLEHTGANAALDTLPDSPYRQLDDPPEQQTTRLDRLPFGGAVEVVIVYKMNPGPTVVNDVEFGPLGETTRPEETVIWIGGGSLQTKSRRYLDITINPVTGIASIGEVTSVPPIGSS